MKAANAKELTREEALKLLDTRMAARGFLVVGFRNLRVGAAVDGVYAGRGIWYHRRMVLARASSLAQYNAQAAELGHSVHTREGARGFRFYRCVLAEKEAEA